MLKKKKILIIDGYNVLRNNDQYKSLVGDSPNFIDWSSEVLNAAREALLNDVAQMLDKGTEAIIVYDGAGKDSAYNNVQLPSQHVGNIQVIFSNSGESADERIQMLVYNCRQKGFEVTVVTSDFGIQDTTINKGVVRMSSRDFSQTVNDEKSSIPHDEMSSKIEDVVDKTTASKLWALRNSLQ